MFARWVAHLPMLAGPLALAGFILPWTRGPGLLATETYSGLDLARLTAVLRALELPALSDGSLVVLRLFVIAVPVAAAWVTLLSFRFRWHWAYVAGGSYLVVAASAVMLNAVVTGGLLPLPGAILMLLSAVAVAAPRLLDRPGALRVRGPFAA